MKHGSLMKRKMAGVLVALMASLSPMAGSVLSTMSVQSGVTVRSANDVRLWQVYHDFAQKPLVWRWHGSADCAYLTVTCLVERTVLGPVKIERDTGSLYGECNLYEKLGGGTGNRMYDVVIRNCVGEDELSVQSARFVVLPESLELKRFVAQTGKTKVDRDSVAVIPYDSAWSEMTANAGSAEVRFPEVGDPSSAVRLSGTSGFMPLDMKRIAFGEDRTVQGVLRFDDVEACSAVLALRYASVFLVR